jgi:Cu2+-exporting ATPase
VQALLRDPLPELAAPLLRLGRLSWLIGQGVVCDDTALERQSALEADGATVLALAAGSTLLALVAVEDQPRRDAADTLAALRERGLRLGLLSGSASRPANWPGS